MGRCPPSGTAGGFQWNNPLVLVALCRRFSGSPRRKLVLFMLVVQRKDGDVIVLKDGMLEIRLYILLREKNGRMRLGIEAPPSVKITIESFLPGEKAAS